MKSSEILLFILFGLISHLKRKKDLDEKFVRDLKKLAEKHPPDERKELSVWIERISQLGEDRSWH